jgi:hypothetical protein
MVVALVLVLLCAGRAVHLVSGSPCQGQARLPLVARATPYKQARTIQSALTGVDV